MMKLISALIGLVAVVSAQEQEDGHRELRGFRCPGEDKCGKSWYKFNMYEMINESCDIVCTWKVPYYKGKGYSCRSQSTSLCKVRYLFEEGTMDYSNHASDESLRSRRTAEIAAGLQGNLGATYAVKENIFVQPDVIDTVMDYMDSTLEERVVKGDTIDQGVEINKDIVIPLEAETLKNLIGMENILSIYTFIKEYDADSPVSRVVARRISYDNEMHMSWHVDGEESVVTHVFLNDVEDGNFSFLGPNGVEEVVGKTGTCLVHGHSIVHGMASFSGLRYTLVFISDNHDATDIVEELIMKEGVSIDVY